MRTKDIRKIEVRKGSVGKDLYTAFSFFYKAEGTKYYIDNIAHDFSSFNIRNSKSGASKIVLTESEIENGRYSKTCFFTDEK